MYDQINKDYSSFMEKKCICLFFIFNCPLFKIYYYMCDGFVFSPLNAIFKNYTDIIHVNIQPFLELNKQIIQFGTLGHVSLTSYIPMYCTPTCIIPVYFSDML